METALVVVDKSSKLLVDIEAKPGIVGSRYFVDKRIGEGSFGVIYKGVECRGNYRVAIKFENRKTSVPQLRDEFRTYRMLNDFMKGQQQVIHQTNLKNGKLFYGGVPQAYYFGQDSIYNCLVMDLLGPSLEELFDQCGRKFTIPTVCQIAIQMLYLIEMIHNCGLTYRDIKPDNFLIGANNLIYIVDFGMAKAFLDQKTLQHIPYREKKSLSGTARYMSINTHLGREQSRRDDLEALGHVFFYFLRGSLPWQGLTAASNKEKYEKIGMKKQDISMMELCNGLPVEFGKYLQYARGLKFDATPDYNMLRDLMSKVMSRHSSNDQFKYDWAQFRSTWEPELLSKVNENELNRLKLEAMTQTQSQINGPMSPNSIGSTNYSCPYSTDSTYQQRQQFATTTSPLAHRSVAIFKDTLDKNNNITNNIFPFSSRSIRIPIDESQIPQNYQQENSQYPKRNWIRRLFCL